MGCNARNDDVFVSGDNNIRRALVRVLVASTKAAWPATIGCRLRRQTHHVGRTEARERTATRIATRGVETDIIDPSPPYSPLFSSIHHYSSLFNTIQHYSSLFSTCMRTQLGHAACLRTSDRCSPAVWRLCQVNSQRQTHITMCTTHLLCMNQGDVEQQ